MNNVDENVTGAFVDSLKRNNKQIRDDRALAIVDKTQMIYRRQVEDLEVKIKSMKYEQAGMIDLSPTDADSLTLASDFDSIAYSAKDLELGVKIKNNELKLEIAKERYVFLFGSQ